MVQKKIKRQKDLQMVKHSIGYSLISQMDDSLWIYYISSMRWQRHLALDYITLTHQLIHFFNAPNVVLFERPFSSMLILCQDYQLARKVNAALLLAFSPLQVCSSTRLQDRILLHRLGRWW